MSKFHAPEAFDFAQPSSWLAWRQRFARFRIATKLDKEDGDVQVNSLLYAMGKQAEPIFGTFTFSAEEENDYYNAVVKRFDEHFVPKRNLIHDRACFHKRSQRSGESVEAFVRCLYELAEFCEFGATKDEQIRDRIVIGIADSNVSEKLQLEPDLTLEKAIQISRQSEQIKTQSADIRGACDVNEVGYKSKYMKHTGGKYRNSDVRQRDESNKVTCSRCARVHEYGACPARGKRCRKCNKTGHFEVAL